MPIDRLAHLRGQRAEPERRGGYRGFSMNPIWIIIAVNLAFYIGTLINRDVIYYLGLIPVEFTSHPWTIVTNMFIHAGFWHLFGNMLVLFFFGRALTMLVGENKFLLVYFVGGIFGNILYLLLSEPLSIAVGASGAVYAIAGALVVMRPNTRVLLYFFIPMPLWLVVLVFFGIWSIPNFIPGVAWQAHIGGLVVGLIAGFFFRRRERSYYYR